MVPGLSRLINIICFFCCVGIWKVKRQQIHSLHNQINYFFWVRIVVNPNVFYCGSFFNC